MSRFARLLPWALGFILLTAGAAAANPGPAPMQIFIPFLLIFLLVLLSTVGGAYPILAHLDPSRNRWWRIAIRWLGGTGIILMGAVGMIVVSESLVGRLRGELSDPATLIFVGVGVGAFLVLIDLWLRRSAEMLWWARTALSSDPKPAHLMKASPSRLSLAGVLLLVLPLMSVSLIDLSVRLIDLKPRPPRGYARAASDAKTAVLQAIVYAKDKGVYPSSLKVLRDGGYASVLDTDRWGNPYILSPQLRQGAKPNEADDIYIYSRGPRGTGQYRQNVFNTGKNDAVGYSSLYGYFQGEE